MAHESQNTSPVRLAPSSEMWGDDTVRLDGAYHIAASSLQPNESSRGRGYSRLVVATRYGRKLMLKALREDVRGVLQYEELLRKEFEILFTLTHDNIVRALSFDEIEGLGHCIVMEYVEGMTLGQFLKRKEGREDKCAILTEVLHAVDYIHSRGVLHRDLTPANIIVLPDNRHIRLIDFGFADSAAYEVLKQPCGTPGFVATEQRAGISDVRNDIYSLGCIMQAMQLGPAYASIVDKCLLPLDERPASVRELLHAHELILQQAASKNPLPYLFAIPALLVIIAIVGWLLTIGTPSAADGSASAEEQLPVAVQPPADSASTDRPSAHLLEQEASVPSPNAITPQESEQDAYKRLMAEGQRMIDRDARRIDQIMDTVSCKEYMPADYLDFLSTESKKIHQFAVSHQSSIPGHYAAFYDSIFSYYSTRYADKWSRRTKELYGE